MSPPEAARRRLLRRRQAPVPASVAYVTRTGCSRCAELLPLVTRVSEQAGLILEVVDVDALPARERARWSDRVPVVLLDGAEHASWEIQEKPLRRALGLRG